MQCGDGFGVDGIQWWGLVVWGPQAGMRWNETCDDMPVLRGFAASSCLFDL